MNGFCSHKAAITGLDAYYCPDCKRTFEHHTPTYKALAQRSDDADSESDEIERLRKEAARLREQLKAAENTIARAKDINSVVRPSFKRVMRLVADACMSLQRVAGGWLLKLGHMSRRFRNLYQIWDLLLADDWCLGDIFPLTTPVQEHPISPRLRPRNPSIAPAVPDPIPIPI